jgi:hypothetical protein
MKYTHSVLLSCILFLLPVFVNASESSGTIQSGNKNALVCHSVDCVSPAPGVINFAPTGTTPVTITDAGGIDGIAWGNEIGWINFDPTGAEGVTINPTTGVLSGKAWSQVSGWINFSVTGQSVVINNAGEFFGYAWAGGPYGGWIKFDCAFAGACVKTDWRPVSARVATNPSTPTASPGSTAQTPDTPIVDACPNVMGQQDEVPTNYSKDQGGLCLIKIDYCKNIEGEQLTIPSQYILDGSGQCVVLSNENKDEFFPAPIMENGEKKYEYDYCPNFFGTQSQIPPGFVLDGAFCVPSELDYCPNIYGNQYSLPEKMKISNEGYCENMTKKEIVQYFGAEDTNKILGYSFVPNLIQVPVVFPFLQKNLIIGGKLVDLWSFCVSILVLTGVGIIVIRRVRFFVKFFEK